MSNLSFLMLILNILCGLKNSIIALVNQVSIQHDLTTIVHEFKIQGNLNLHKILFKIFIGYHHRK